MTKIMTMTFISNFRFLRDPKNSLSNENAKEYLKNYCDWQAKKKIRAKTFFYSVLLTGMDLFHVKNGKQSRTSTGDFPLELELLAVSIAQRVAK